MVARTLVLLDMMLLKEPVLLLVPPSEHWRKLCLGVDGHGFCVVDIWYGYEVDGVPIWEGC